MAPQTNAIKTCIEGCRHAFVYVGLFSVLVNLLMLTVPLYMLQLFDRVLASQSYETLAYLTLIAIVALLALGLLEIARSRILVRVSQWLDNQLSTPVLLKSADHILQGNPYGGQGLRDISTIRQFLAGPSIFSFFDAPWTPIYLIVVFLLQPMLGVIATLGSLILLALAILNETTTRKDLNQANIDHLKNQQWIDRALNNAEVIQALGLLPAIVRHWCKDNKKVLSHQGMASDRAGLILGISKFARLTLQLSILGIGAYFVIDDRLTPGAMIAASIITARALGPIEQSISSWKLFVAARQCYRRLNKFLSYPELRQPGIELAQVKGKVNIEKVTYIPPGSKTPILYGINLQVATGETLVIIGPSGAGKSTLARLLLGVWKPTQGNVRLDAADVYDWERVNFAANVGYLPQDIDLFLGTVKENITRLTAAEEIEDVTVIAAAKMAGAHEFILKLPQGYDFNIDYFNLSGGQRQRIALARAFYGNPKFVVLDEPNSNLDKEGVAALIQTIKRAQEQNITLVIITHLPSILQLANTIALLKEGHLIMHEPRDQVLNKLAGAVKHGEQRT